VLETLGLDRTAETVYRTMLANDGWGVAQIAGHLSLAEAEVRAALDRLAGLALLRWSFDEAGPPRPVSPDVGLNGLLARHEAELLRRQQQLAESQAAIAQLLAEHVRPGMGPPTVDELTTMDAVLGRLEQLAHRATGQCVSLMPGGGQSTASLAASGPLDELLLSRGVTVLTVYLDSMRNDPATIRYAHWLTELGGAVRTSPTLPLRMVVFDSTTAIVPLDPDNTRLGAVEVTGRGVVRGLMALFERVWEQAAPFGTADTGSEAGGLTSQQRELLRLLARGLTDEAAGKQLGLSLRTVRRMMAELMDRLGARSRFEAGVRAAQQQWLSESRGLPAPREVR
jgi:DNA-binding CsgD family transcriptional regulator